MNHKSNIIDEASAYYTEKAREYDSGPQASDWNSIEAQEIRFEQLCKVLPDHRNETFTICDYGCGMGDLNPYIGRSHTDFSYTGMDVSEEIINKAKSRNERNKGVFLQGYEIRQPFDYIVASGIFNVRQTTPDEEWNRYIIKTIQMFNRFAVRGFAFNCLTKYSDKEHMKDYLYYADPLRLFDYCKRNFAKDVALLHDYGIYDFTIIVRKER